MQGTTWRAACAAMAAPVAAEPTKTTSRVCGCDTAAAPVAGPEPASTDTSPRGIPACSHSTPSASVLSGVSSEGLSTTALPAHTAGAICQPAVNSGAFHGVSCTTVPKGSCRV